VSGCFTPFQPYFARPGPRIKIPDFSINPFPLCSLYCLQPDLQGHFRFKKVPIGRRLVNRRIRLSNFRFAARAVITGAAIFAVPFLLGIGFDKNQQSFLATLL